MEQKYYLAFFSEEEKPSVEKPCILWRIKPPSYRMQYFVLQNIIEVKRVEEFWIIKVQDGTTYCALPK